MALYQFKSDDGDTIEVSGSMRRPPTRPIRRGGKLYRRVIISPGVNDAKEFKPYISRAMPRRVPGFKHTDSGLCVVESRAQERDYARRMGMEFVTSRE